MLLLPVSRPCEPFNPHPTRDQPPRARSPRPGGLSQEQVIDFEDALSDIFLLGKSDEIEASYVIMVDMAEGGSAALDPLINALRNSLRKEIELTQSSLPKPYVLRIEDSKVLAPSALRRTASRPE